MDWLVGLQNSIDYIEEHITEPLGYEEIAAKLHVSSFYFQRIFSALCGFTVGEYIRNRRLALAGSELALGNAKIIDIALKYGYDSPEGFTRAFTRFHGVTPSAVKAGAAGLKSFARLSINIQVKGGYSMNYKIEKKDAFKIIAKTERFSKINPVNRTDIPEFWEQCHSDGTVSMLDKISKKDGVLNGRIVGMCREDSTKVPDFPYSVGAEYDGGEVPSEFSVHEIPEATWAVFEIKGIMPEAIQSLWHQIFAEFFPSSEYMPSGNLDLEVYPLNAANSDKYSAEIWIAVEKKKMQ